MLTAYLFLCIAMIAQYLSYFGRLTGIEGFGYNRVMAIEQWPNASLCIIGLRNNRSLTQALNSGLVRQDRNLYYLDRALVC